MDTEEKNWRYYKDKIYADYKKNRKRWTVDYIIDPKSPEELIGSLAFLKDDYSDDFDRHSTMQTLIDYANKHFKDVPLIKRNLPNYQRYLDEDQDFEDDYQNMISKNKRRDISMVIVCIVAIIAIGIEVPLLHWWAILSGILTLAVPFMFYCYYCYID
ncbi:MAG: hypothetical protein IJ756_08660 [Paludibacteraceae bacterium]|nr:hypothetical protein [Paludibacteraceae bacterium]